MSATNPPPPKLKAALTHIQKSITSLENDDSGVQHHGIESIAKQSSLAFQLLLSCELASRGVLVPFDVDVDVITADESTAAAIASSLLTTIRDVAGRVSLDEVTTNNNNGNYPAPMMAYLNAAAGMAAAACASSLDRLANELEGASLDTPSISSEGLSSLFLPVKVTSSALWNEATKRCLEVKDGRFYSLLRLAADGACLSTDESKRMSRGGTIETLRRLTREMNSISYSSYFYGADHFAKDQPQLWKRCLDAALSMNEDGCCLCPDRIHGPKLTKSRIRHQAYITTPQTVLPLTNMIRIAQSKGNQTRSNELQLFLAAGCIAAVSDKLERLKSDLMEGTGSHGGSRGDYFGTNTDSPSMENQPLNQLIRQYFLHRSRSIVEMDQMTLTTLRSRADLELTKCPSPENYVLSSNDTDEASYETWLFQQYLRQHLRNLHRESDVGTEVQLRHRAMLNRLPESGTSAVGSSKGKGGSSKTTSGVGGGISLSSGKASKSTTASGTKSLSSTKSSIGVGSSASSSEAISLREMERDARANLCWETWKQSKLEFIEWESLFVTSLRDAMVRLSSLPSPSPFDEDDSCPWFIRTELVRDCYEALTHQTRHLVDNAMTIQKHLTGKKENKSTVDDVSLAWRGVFAFVSPLLDGHLFEIVQNATSSPLFSSSEHGAFRRFVEECAKSLITATWMYEPFVSCTANEGRGLLEDASRLISISHECLAASQKGRLSEEQAITNKMKVELSSDVGGASTSMTSARDSYADEEKNEIFQLECALASSTCRMDLENTICDVDGDELVSTDSLATMARKASMAATQTHQLIVDFKVSSSFALTSRARFGGPYLQALSAWSGMFLTPWPFCTIGQERTILRNARDVVAAAGKAWGRPTHWKLEQIVLDTAEADLEGGLVGGFASESERLYKRVLECLAGEDGSVDGCAAAMLRVHCLLGFGKLYLSVPDRLAEAEAFARNALDNLSSLDPTQRSHVVPRMICIYPWNDTLLMTTSYSYHVCVSRQLVAEACIRSSRYDDAKLFLSDAVKDLPGNFDAAFALAAFHLRIMFDGDTDTRKKNNALARTLLLKAAKMDTTKAGPFALLGVWYESQNDEARAKGCYQKALSIDPSHPVAGRGLHRIFSLDELQPLCEKAAKQYSPVNGWAWRFLGQKRSWVDGDDSSAVICFQQALRCRDIQGQGSDSHEVFYLDPKNTSIAPGRESGETWGELANCYRRLGKYSAAARAYEEASMASDDCMSPSTRCAWAQVQLDLGLYDEAAEKCDDILSSGIISPIHRMAAYIESEALLALAKSDVQEGKFGLCLSHLQRGIDRLNLSVQKASSELFYCVIKLMGDLFTFAETLPSYVFHLYSRTEETHEDESDFLSREIQNQLSFIAKGEEAYMMAQKLAENERGSDEDNSYLVAAAASDLGTNLLAQARVYSSALGEGSGGGTKTSMYDMAARNGKIMDLIRRSINSYTKAIDSNPHDASAWTGLGAALATVDPLLSQHAFCRALQIDKSLADPLSNIGMMYADFGKIDTSSEVLDALTQVADTPLMWIGRGLLLEKSSIQWERQSEPSEACMIKAADAYRAALQIMQNPAALMGLSLTCRRSYNGFGKSRDAVYSYLSNRASKSESKMSMKIHQNLTGSGNFGACFLDGLMTIEEGLERRTALDDSESLSIINEGKSILADVKIRTKKYNDAISPQRETKSDEITLPEKRSLHPRMTGAFPSDLVDVVQDEPVPDVVESDLLPEAYSIYDARNSALLNPESGEAWLQYAKTQLLELSCTTSLSTENRDSDTMTEELKTIKDAATKAFQLLQSRVNNASLISPRRHHIHRGSPVEYSEKSVVSSIPSSALLSEALCLLSRVEDAESLDRGDPLSLSSYVCLQESLLLDPSNIIAMEALEIDNVA